MQCKIEELDKKALTEELTSDEWNQRYSWENDLEHIYEMEELYWHKRCGEQWILEGDRNTEFFHRVANGRKRKCHITSLMDGETELTSKSEIESTLWSTTKPSLEMSPLPTFTFPRGFGRTTSTFQMLVKKT